MTSASQDNHKFERDDLPPPYQAAVETILAERVPEIDLDRLISSATTTIMPSGRRHWLMRVGGWSLAAAATAALVLAGIVVLRPASAWAQVAQAVGKQAWVRLSIASPDGSQRAEMWFSPTKKLAASKFSNGSSFLDLNQNDAQRFDKAENVIYRSEPQSVDEDQLAVLFSLFESFATGGRKNVQAGTIKLKHRESNERQAGDQRWTEHILDWEDVRRTPAEFREVFHVPEGQQLPTKMVQTLMIDDKPMERSFDIDYPATGPTDLYALEVPRDTKVVEMRAGAALKQLLVEFHKQQQIPLPRYSATALATFSWSDWNDVFEAYRIRGDENLVVDQTDMDRLLELRHQVWEKKLTIPNGADKLAWWKAELGNVPFERSQITQSSFIPGQAGYPLIGLPGQTRRATLELRSAFGPSNCPRVTVDDPKTGEKKDVYWFDPSRGHMIVRWENYHRGNMEAHGITTTVVDAAEQAPGGRWYATCVRSGFVRQSGDELPNQRPGGHTVYRVLVEFDKP